MRSSTLASTSVPVMEPRKCKAFFTSVAAQSSSSAIFASFSDSSARSNARICRSLVIYAPSPRSGAARRDCGFQLSQPIACFRADADAFRYGSRIILRQIGLVQQYQPRHAGGFPQQGFVFGCNRSGSVRTTQTTSPLNRLARAVNADALRLAVRFPDAPYRSGESHALKARFFLIKSRVVPASAVTMARSMPSNAFISEDLPTFGLPTMATRSRRAGRARAGIPQSAFPRDALPAPATPARQAAYPLPPRPVVERRVDAGKRV